MTVRDLAKVALSKIDAAVSEQEVDIVQQNRILPSQQPLATLLPNEGNRSPRLTEHIQRINNRCCWCKSPLQIVVEPPHSLEQELRSQQASLSSTGETSPSRSSTLFGTRYNLGPLESCPFCKESPAWHHSTCCRYNRGITDSMLRSCASNGV